MRQSGACQVRSGAGVLSYSAQFGLWVPGGVHAAISSQAVSVWSLLKTFLRSEQPDQVSAPWRMAI
jgi:hypothetical protein